MNDGKNYINGCYHCSPKRQGFKESSNRPLNHHFGHKNVIDWWADLNGIAVHPGGKAECLRLGAADVRTSAASLFITVEYMPV